MPLLDGAVVVVSKIHGYGVVTTRRFTKGELVCYGDGVLYTADADFDDTYALILPGEDSGKGDTLFWDLVCQSRWLNHSCDPNSEVLSKWDHEANTMRAWWVALRDIEIGEEITYDYAFAGEVAEPCACGTARCRGLIVDDEDPENVAKVPEHLRSLLRGSQRRAS
jgi:SET domain-containing protein